jgi:DNA-binding CsgD family transcriptional regulator
MKQRGPHLPNVIAIVMVAARPRAARLPAVQQRILRLAALGCDDRQIAGILGRNVDDVRRHKARALRKLAARGRRGLIRWTIDQGLSYPGDQLSPAERWAGWA